ncbi:hypothetical protein GE061_011921 [Apolygus lucorum]|uniref:Winged helix Storkhead-box1 domain-containing protein n=1 Tax=Apolygus lucorum TaxID=248454 RepID=A0A8S9XS66_APOLU|nr:hypothetical protein GE061_011921 [Apolygus lucorum]
MSGQITGKAQCLSLLQDCLALQLQRIGPPSARSPAAAVPTKDSQYWMYDSGYLIFQGFLEANLKCFWDGSLVAAVRGLEFMGYVCPGVLLVTGSPPSLHLIRSAWSRSVLKPPPNYLITLLGDVEDCTVSKVRQASFTPLSDAVCWVILQLGAAGQIAVLDTIRSAIKSSFPSIEIPSTHQLYDTLADLTATNKVYQTAQGYFVATPDSVRLTEAATGGRNLLLSQAEAAALVHGEIVTIREGHKTHQSIQTNLADVICGGNKNDKTLYPRAVSRGTYHRKLERRHSMRLLGSSRKLSTLHRAGSVRLLHHNISTEIPSKKCSLLSKIFRWPRKHAPAGSYSSPSLTEQTPPVEWFNSSVLNCRSVGTQTLVKEKSSDGTDWVSECGTIRSRRRSMSTSRLPRRRSRAPSISPSRPSSPSTPSSSKTVLCTTTPKAMSSASSGYNSLPRSHKSRAKSAAASSQSSPKAPPRLPTSSHSSIKVEVSSNPANGIMADTKVDTRMTASTNDPSAMLTTTINGPNSTKIYLQQQNSPMRSVITFEKARKPSPRESPSEIKVAQEEERSKSESRRSRRPLSLYQQKEAAKDTTIKSKVNISQLENNLKMKFPSTETIQLEEKLLTTDEKNNKNVFNKKNVFDSVNLSIKAGSLVDVAHTDERLNNIKKASFSLSPLQPALSSDRVLENLNIKNIFKDNGPGSPTKIEDKNLCFGPKKSIDIPLKSGENDLCPFPSLSDLSLHFTSLAAQNILNGVSINSIDTLVEVNMAAEKHNNSIHTDLGVV